MDRYSNARMMYESGLSVGDVATYYGITRQAMWKILLRRGVAMRPQRKTGKANHFWRGRSLKSKRAGHMVDLALEKGLMVKRPCEVCGASDVTAHHDDYNLPLSIRWLCSEHHFAWHRSHVAVALTCPLPVTPSAEVCSMGGKASAANMTPEQRSERSRQACIARWSKHG